MTLTTEQAIETLNDMLAFEIDEFGEAPVEEEAVYMAINALRGEEPPGEFVSAVFDPACEDYDGPEDDDEESEADE